MTSASDLPTSAEPAPDAEPSGDAEPAHDAEPKREGGPLTRRSFVVRAMVAIGALIAAMVAIPVAGFAAMPFFRARTPMSLLSGMVTPTVRSQAWADAGSVDDYKVGEPHLVPLQREVNDGWVSGTTTVAVYVVRETETDFRAFDIHCTHLGCPLSFSSGAGKFMCPCHGGNFDIEGNVTGGPPPRPMIQYAVQVVDGNVQVGALEPGA